jgi:hypothetical protein
MDNQVTPAAMSQMIFNMGLSVETISVYLLCCSFYDSGTTISTKKLSDVWNSTKDVLCQGLEELEKRNIIRQVISDQKETAVYRLIDAKDWQAS